MKLDRIDCGILVSLQKDARMSNKDLAAKNNISPSTCLERVRRLRSGGVIQGFRTVLNPSALGIGVQAMIAVKLTQQGIQSFEELRDGLLEIPEVVSVYLLGGGQDFLVHVAAQDVVHLRTLLAESFMARGDIAHIETSLIFEYARRPVLPNYNGETNGN